MAESMGIWTFIAALALVLIASVAQALNRCDHVSRSLGQGTRFRVTLPLATA